MKRLILLVAVALALIAVPSAESKFGIFLAVEPSRPVAKQPVRVTIRTGIELPARHGMRLQAVGAARTNNESDLFFDVRLLRTGPRAFRAIVPFPRPGRWRLIVPNWGAPGSASPAPVDRAVRVRPST